MVLISFVCTLLAMIHDIPRLDTPRCNLYKITANTRRAFTFRELHLEPEKSGTLLECAGKIAKLYIGKSTREVEAEPEGVRVANIYKREYNLDAVVRMLAGAV